MPATAVDLELADFVAQFYADPLGFVVQACYPWQEPGVLSDHAGPDIWQAQFLRDVGADVAARGFDGVQPVQPIRRAISSGHGIGKSVVVAWLVDWIMSTRPHCQGTVTATGGGGDLTVDNTSIAAAQAVTITSFSFTDANA